MMVPPLLVQTVAVMQEEGHLLPEQTMAGSEVRGAVAGRTEKPLLTLLNCPS
jgi:hypothetical protein